MDNLKVAEIRGMSSDELRQVIHDTLAQAIDVDAEIRTAQAQFRATDTRSDPEWYNKKQTERRRLLLVVRTLQDELRDRTAVGWHKAFYELCRVRFDQTTLDELADSATRVTNLKKPEEGETCEICEKPMEQHAEGLRCPTCDRL